MSFEKGEAEAIFNCARLLVYQCVISRKPKTVLKFHTTDLRLCTEL